MNTIKHIIAYLTACLIFTIGVLISSFLTEIKDINGTIPLIIKIILALVGSLCLSPALTYWYNKFKPKTK